MEGKKEYYNVAGIEAYDIMDATLMYAFESNAFKYLYRCNEVLPKGDRLGDLKKAEHYLIKMLENPKHIRVNNGERFIKLLNPSVFSNDIYNAICEIITGVAIAGSNYSICTTNALEYVRNEISRY